MAKVILTVRLDPDHATLADVQERLSLGEKEIDSGFGVVPIDPDLNLYAVLVDERSASKAASAPGVKGPFSNPRIETFGSPSAGDEPPS